MYSTFAVKSGSGLTYSVGVRDLSARQFACDCVDFRINGLGTCKHVEAVLLYLERRYRRLLKQAALDGSERIEVVVDRVADNLRVARGKGELPAAIRKMFDGEGLLMDASPEAAVQALRKHASGCPRLRISQEIEPWLEHQRRLEERKRLRREYELKVQSGEWPPHETNVPLFPYQREGMLHLAFTERALLADEMGLGKTIQAIAACALLHRLGKANRVLVVTPASLKTEWEEQIRQFTTLPYQLVFGGALGAARTLTRTPTRPSSRSSTTSRCSPTRSTSTRACGPTSSCSTKPSASRTGAPKPPRPSSACRAATPSSSPARPSRTASTNSIRSWISSIPRCSGRCSGSTATSISSTNGAAPRAIATSTSSTSASSRYMLRRRKTDVETELPDRTDRNHFVQLSAEQQDDYDGHERKSLRAGPASPNAAR